LASTRSSRAATIGVEPTHADRRIRAAGRTSDGDRHIRAAGRTSDSGRHIRGGSSASITPTESSPPARPRGQIRQKNDSDSANHHGPSKHLLLHSFAFP